MCVWPSLPSAQRCVDLRDTVHSRVLGNFQIECPVEHRPGVLRAQDTQSRLVLILVGVRSDPDYVRHGSVFFLCGRRGRVWLLCHTEENAAFLKIPGHQLSVMSRFIGIPTSIRSARLWTPNNSLRLRFTCEASLPAADILAEGAAIHIICTSRSVNTAYSSSRESVSAFSPDRSIFRDSCTSGGLCS